MMPALGARTSTVTLSVSICGRVVGERQRVVGQRRRRGVSGWRAVGGRCDHHPTASTDRKTLLPQPTEKIGK